MDYLLFAYIAAVALCLANCLDRLLHHRQMRSYGINSRRRPMPMDWLLALVPPAYLVRRFATWRLR